MSRAVKNILSLSVSLALIAISIWGVLHRQEIWDWARLRTYQPTEDIVQLADRTTMHGQGRDMFFVSMPQINSRDSFNQHCKNDGEQSIVLGCYTAQRIYLYNVIDSQLNGVKEVTAAHEMLHAAYERLGTGERQHVDGLIQAQLKTITDARLTELITLYNKHEPGQLYNEMHSILGTEYRALSADLETYYKKYFSDRLTVVSYSEKYEAVFRASKARIAQLDAQLGNLRTQIDRNNQQLETQQDAIKQESDRLDSLRARGDAAAYNAAVPGYNERVRTFNNLVAATKGLVAQYNQLVEERNQQAAAQNDLYHSLDSRYQTITQD